MITKALALNGASKVYICGRRSQILQDAATLSPHNNIIPIVADVSSKESIEALAAKIRQETGYLNLLVANAGTGGPGPIQNPGQTLREVQAEAMKIPMQDWDENFRVNVSGCYFLTMAMLDLLDEGNTRKNFANGAVKSQVLLLGSVGGFARSIGGRYAYRASKAAVTHLGKCLATGFQEFGIRVNVLAPGVFPSELSAGLIRDLEGSADEEGRLDPKRLPERRVGDYEDLAGTVLYLASRAGAYVNGSVHLVDGGVMGVMPATY
jgi:NAD(P)-dependent dehydrogenase (short-subunit alcohol dehydrogenase family)